MTKDVKEFDVSWEHYGLTEDGKAKADQAYGKAVSFFAACGHDPSVARSVLEEVVFQIFETQRRKAK